ncbi:cytochrome P450 [Artomyces pyxidatus]|uniref:Cytochrome P450 n=1 Tax=Artomyces pyxidatus TaxID=48021 RepID=A0ACB8TH78_9AGAM|nr:cytochrome P450 [Artomyces pyxidatus]
MAIFPSFYVGCFIFGTSFVSYLYLKRYEPRSLSRFFICFVCVPCLLATGLVSHFVSFLRAFTVCILSYNALLLGYATVYRLSIFHPLAQYPGPLLPRVSKLRSSYVCAQGRQHVYYQRLHEQYGDFVRVGPNELSIRDASAIPEVLGVGGLPKGPFWDDRPNSGPTLISRRDPVEHARRRKPWNRGFTSAAVRDYEDIVIKRSQQLVERLDGLVQELKDGGNGNWVALDMGAWMSYFSTDLMGDMVFGGGFELVRDGKDSEGIWELMESALETSAIIAHVPWLFLFVQVVPSLQALVDRVQEFARRNVIKRMAMGAQRKDLYFHLSDEEKHESIPPSFEELTADGTLAIVAGSDTSATVLTALFYYLVRRPAAYKRLQEEIDFVFPRGVETTDAAKLSDMTWLNGCINEASRLVPPVPSGGQRTVLRGAGPKVIGKHVVPEGTQVFVHTYSIHRDPRNFSSPDVFLPERWLSRIPQEITAHNPAALFPFSYGPENCAGKSLALLEMRMVVCWLLQQFELQPPGDSDGRLPFDEWETALRDFYVMQKPPLWLKLRRRQ